MTLEKGQWHELSRHALAWFVPVSSHTAGVARVSSTARATDPRDPARPERGIASARRPWLVNEIRSAP